MSDPFRLPDDRVQIAFSGGRTSGYMLHRLIKANGDAIRDEDRVQVVFTNTGREMPQTLDFVAEVGRRWQVPVAWVEWRPGAAGQRFRVVGRQGASENGEPFEALIRQKGYLPNRVTRFCTSELKVRSARDYLRSLGWERWTAAIGIRADEPVRHARAADPKERATRWLPLVPAQVDRAEVSAFWSRQPFDLALPNVNGRASLGNCDGCFLKSEAHRAALARDYPERHAWWERQEETVSREKATEALFDYRGSRQSLRLFVERQGDWLLDEPGALCQASDGECIE